MTSPVLHDAHAHPPPAAEEGLQPQPGKWPTPAKPTPETERQMKTGDSSGFFKKWSEQ